MNAWPGIYLLGLQFSHVKVQLVGVRQSGEISVHHSLGDLLQTGRAPLGTIVLVHQEGPDTLVEVVVLTAPPDEPVLHGQALGQGPEPLALPDLPEGHLHGGRGHLPQVRDLLLAPVPSVLIKIGQDGLHGIPGEALVDQLHLVLQSELGLRKVVREAVQNEGDVFLALVLEVEQLLLDLGQLLRSAHVGRDPGEVAVVTLEPVSGESEEHSKLALESGQEERPADVWEESDPSLRHGKHGLLSADAKFA